MPDVAHGLPYLELDGGARRAGGCGEPDGVVEERLGGASLHDGGREAREVAKQGRKARIGRIMRAGIETRPQA